MPADVLDDLARAASGNFPVLAGVLGLMVGSFLNVVIHRVPREFDREYAEGCRAFLDEKEPPPGRRWGWIGTLFAPPSHCPKCQARLRARENIPVVSWLVLRGRCAHCSAPVSARYPVVEILTALLSAWTASALGWGAPGVAALVLVWFLIALSFIDADTTLLPNQLTHPLLWIGLLLNLRATFVPLEEAVLGAAAGYVALWSVYRLHKVVTGRDGMGYGDFNLLAAIGAWLGWKMLLPVVLLSSLAGALAGIALWALRRRGIDVPIPFGPYLAVAGLLALLHGPILLRILGEAASSAAGAR